MTGADRGRVPFALIGVLALVATAGVVTTTQVPGPTEEPAVDRELDRLAAETQTTLREAALTAAREAAASPVTEPAETPMGAAIRPESAFTDGLRIRLFVRARDSLERLGGSQEGLTVSASLPETKTPAQLRAARDAVAVGRAGENGSKLRVRIANVTLTATRDGRAVANRTVSPTIVVDSPVLVVRDRIEEFERRLEAGITDRGLARRLSAQLHTAAFARGYAQYGGAPIQNVLGNRHVELFTNRALFGVQRSVFGHSDPVGREALRAATVETGLTDLLGGTNRTGVDHLEAARESAGLAREPADRLAGLAAAETYPGPGDRVTTGINESARHVFLAYLTDADVGRVDADRASPEGIDSHVTHTLLTYARVHDEVTPPEYDFAAAIDRTFTERARLTAAVDRLDRSRRVNATPGSDWSAIGRDTETTTTVRDREAAPPPTDRGWTRHAHYPRTVERTQTTTTRYRTPNGTRTIRETVTETYGVDLSVLGRHALGPAPAAPVETAYEAPGPFGGPNLADVPERVRERLVTERGGPDELARRAVAGTLDTEPIEIQGAYPEALRTALYKEVASLRPVVANISTENARGLVGTYQVNPPAQLAERIRERRADLETPETYETVADKARAAVEIAYLEWVAAWLDTQAVGHREERDRLAETLPAGAFEQMQAGVAATRRPRTPPDRDSTDVPMRVATTPSYLPREAVGSDVVPELPGGREWHALAVRNENLVAVPYGDAAGALTRLIFGPERTELRVGAEVLRGATRAVAAGERSNAIDASGTLTDPGLGLVRARDALRGEVQAGTEHLWEAARKTLAEYGLGTPETRRAVLRDAVDPWDDPAKRALAFANGSAADAIVAATADRWGEELSAATLDRLALEIEAAIEAARLDAAARQRVGLVETADDAAGAFVRDQTEELIADGLEAASDRAAQRLIGRTLSTLPQGIPVLAPPFPWVVTANYWTVEARATYPRFTVRAPYGAPDRPGAEFVYVRDGTPARVDVTGDGTPERLGTSERVSFDARIDIVVAVPAGPRGVGDVDGERTEESPGWPRPGPD